MQLSDEEVAKSAVAWRTRGRRGRPVATSRSVVPFNTSLVMLATQFECMPLPPPVNFEIISLILHVASYARMAFPCFDEPSFKGASGENATLA